MAFYTSVVFFPQTNNPSIIMQKTSYKSQTRTLYNVLDLYASKLQGHQEQGKSEKLSQPRGA